MGNQDAGGQQSTEAHPQPALTPASSGNAHQPARSLAQLENSQMAIRDTTKWLVAAAAAVGAIVVAGLQLRDLPHGTLATSVALLGVIAALGAIAYILYRAAVVLAMGYTTFGAIVDLDSDRGYIRQQNKATAWGKRIRHYEDMQEAPEDPPSTGPGKALSAIRRAYAGTAVLVMRAARELTLRQAKSEDIRIGKLISYLNRDASFFSQGRAANINQLYRAVTETDKEILSLRGEKIGGMKIPMIAKEAESLKPISISASEESSQALGPSPTEGPGQALLEKADWRREGLESAMTIIIAFANQNLLEQRFRKLVAAIIVGGLVVAVGAGAFAVAPKLAESQPLSITQPTRVTITIVSFGLGRLCPPGTLLQGVAVGGTWGAPIVVTEKAGTCPAQHVTLDHGQAIAVPELG
jgi:hypothetical protein